MKHSKWMVIAAIAVAIGCGGDGSGSGKLDTASRQAEWTALEGLKKQVDAKRAELATLREQAAGGADVAAALTTTNNQVTELSDELGSRLAAYINEDPPVLGETVRPDQLAALRMKSAEDISIAKEFIDLGGDYRRALDIYHAALTVDPDNPALQAAIADAEAKRFMTLERFGIVRKGMSETEVIAALGRPLMRNIRDYPEKKVTAWFYPKNEGGEAAGVFFNDKKVVYSTDFEAVKQAAGQ